MRSREERETRTGRRGGREIAEQWRNATDVASERCRRRRTGRTIAKWEKCRGRGGETIRERERVMRSVMGGHGVLRENKGEWEITCAEVEDGRDVGWLVREGKVEGQQLCGCWARVGRVVETAARAGVGEGRLERVRV